MAYVPRGHVEGTRVPPGPDGRTQKQLMLAGEQLDCLTRGATLCSPAQGSVQPPPRLQHAACCRCHPRLCQSQQAAPANAPMVRSSSDSYPWRAVKPSLCAGESYDPNDPELVDARIAARRQACSPPAVWTLARLLGRAAPRQPTQQRRTMPGLRGAAQHAAAGRALMRLRGCPL